MDKKQRDAAWRARNRDKIRVYMRGYRARNKTVILESQKKCYWNDPEKYRGHRRRWYQRNKDAHCLKAKARLELARTMVIKHYSGGTCVCNCCGEGIREFLAIDHINGKKNYPAALRTNALELCRALIRLGFPEGFQILCHNCNMAKGFFGACPHKILTTQYKKQFMA